jgi:hypothetical protein
VKINDDRAFTEERRNEAQSAADMVLMSQLESPGAPAPLVDGSLLADAMSHIDACDGRARNMWQIFENIQKVQDELAGLPEGTLVSGAQLAQILGSAIQEALAKVGGGGEHLERQPDE